MVLAGLRALKFYADPRNWKDGAAPSGGPEKAQEAMQEIAYEFVPKDEPTKISLAPWSNDQVLSLNGYQECSRYHPFTYGDGDEKVDLIATNAGWVAYPAGPVVQAWAHRWMADWSWDLKPCLPI